MELKKLHCSDAARLRAEHHGLYDLRAEPAGLRAFLHSGREVTIEAAQLAEDAPNAFDPHSGQRTRPVVRSAAPPILSAARATTQGVEIEFASGDAVTLSYGALADLCRTPGDERRDRLDGDALPIRGCAVTRFFAESAERRTAFATVVRDGVCLLHDLPTEPGALERVVATFGAVRETNYGRVFDVRVEPRPDNLAFSAAALAPHTDNPYREPPPSLQLLHCLQAAEDGGETILIDGFAAAERFRAAEPAAFAELAQVAVRFAWRGPDVRLEARAPVVTLDVDGNIVALRVNDRALAPLDIALERRTSWRRAYAAFMAAIEGEPRATRLALAPGDVLILDNRRILHSRSAYGGGARWLQGCYAERADLLSSLALLEEAEARARAGEALDLLAGPAGDALYGEGMSLRSHALQAASRARAERRPEAFVAAALLHDIGWALAAGPHDISGAWFAAARFGDAVATPIALHVAAKRYLVSVEPSYEVGLSSASRATLAEQGGPMTPAEVDVFETRLGFADAVALRRIDDLAKDANQETLPLDAFQDLLTGLALKAVRAEERH